MICFLRILLVSNLLFLGTAKAVEVDIKRGEVVAAVRCGPCHHLYSNHIKVGPSLVNIYGKKPSISGVPFAIWDDDALHTWLINPRLVKGNTRMVLPAMSERDRNDIIAWLKANAVMQ